MSSQRPPPRCTPIVVDVGALVDPDVRAVDALARMQVVARRAGCTIRLRDATDRLRELVELMGLRDALPCE